MNAIEKLSTPARAANAGAESTELERLLQREFKPQDLMHGDNLDRIERIADRLANGRMTVPEYLRGNPGDCMAIAMQAMLWGMDPFVVAQKTHIVNGRLGYEAQLVNAVVMSSGAIRGSFCYEYRGDGQSLECRVGAVLRGQADVTWGEWLSSASVATKNSPLWKVNPRQQMGYLQVKNWARAFCPGAILGVYTVDELDDLPPIGARSSASIASASQPTLPPYSDDAFEKNLPTWRKLVESGKKSAPELMAMLATKAYFSEEQRAQILSLKVAQPEPEQGAKDDGHDDFRAGMDAGEGGAK